MQQITKKYQLHHNFRYNKGLRRGVRVVEGTRLERVYGSNVIQGSNPCLSARREMPMPLGVGISLFVKRKGFGPGFDNRGRAQELAPNTLQDYME